MQKSFRYIVIIFLTTCFGNINQIEGQNLVFLEELQSCSFENNWTWQPIGNSQGEWTIVKLRNSTDNSCSFSLVDNLSSKGDTTIIDLKSKWLVAYDYDELNIDFDLIFFKNNAQAHVFDFMIDFGNGPELINSYSQQVFGKSQSDFEHQTYQLTIEPGAKFQLIYRYNSNGFKSSYVQMDNIKVTGPVMADCNSAFEIKSIGNCIKSSNKGASFSLDQPTCSSNNSSAIWYQYIAEFTGIVKISTNADFNDAITLYERTCEKEDEVGCSDRDEYGFEGDELYANIKKDAYYFIRISGVQNQFSVAEGDFCFMMEQVDTMPARPVNDWCKNAQEINVDSLCIAGTNINADLDGPLPTLNHRSKADIWYYFDYLNQSSQQVIISTNADFSDVITVYKGNCDKLEEVHCSVEGGVALLSDLEEGQRYFIQISSYFSTLEGNVCMELYGFENTVSLNDSCFQAINVEVDGDCVEASNEGAEFEGVRASCIFEAESDIWFEFVSPSDGSIIAYPEAHFLYNVAVYHGKCDSLVEVFCSANNNLCEGFLSISSLLPNEKYFLQISSAYQHSGAITGDVCLQIYSKLNAPDFIPLTVQVNEECIAGVLSRLKLEINGGKGQLDIQGFDAANLYEIGGHYIVSVEDENGCRVFVEGDVSCPDKPICRNDSFSIVVNPSCEVDKFGLNTGFVIFDYEVNNGSQNIMNLGTQKGAKLAHGDQYKIYVIDLKDSCLQIQEGIIDCPPFDCTASTMKMDLSFECIDSLLKAKLIVDVQDGFGAYTFVGDHPGELFSNGDTVITTVIDEKGCELMISTVVDCQFDSCAFSKLTATVEIECLTNKFGNETGFAVVSIKYNGGVGQVDFDGLADGDTLFFGDKFELIAKDEWGCESIVSGEIECEPNTAVEDVWAVDEVLIYPNPTQKLINISWNEVDMKLVKAELISNKGTKLTNYSPILNRDNELTFDVENLLPGVYFIQIRTVNSHIIRKFVKL